MAETAEKTTPSPDREGAAQRYARGQRWLFLAQVALGVAWLLFLLAGGLAGRYIGLEALPLPLAVAFYFTLLLAVYMGLAFPLSLYRSFLLPRAYGLSSLSFRGWLARWSRETLLGWLVGLTLMVSIYLLLEWTPQWWWLGAGGLILLLSLAFTFVGPLVILPFFYPARPLEDDELSRRLAHLAQRAGFSPRGLFVLEEVRGETAVGALSTGLGRTRRILLSYNLLHQYAAPEVEAILAHELGHLRHRHLPRLLAFQAALALLAFALVHLALGRYIGPAGPEGLPGLAVPASLPLLVLVLVLAGLALAPAFLAFSRHLERQADAFSLGLTGNPQAFIQAMERLTAQSFIPAHPSRWAELLFYDHPPLGRRLALARHHRASSAGGEG